MLYIFVHNINDGPSQSYIYINIKVARRLKLPLIPVNKEVSRIFKGPSVKIENIAYFLIDIRGR